MWSSISLTLRKLVVALMWFGMLVLACRGEPDESGDATDFRGGEPPQGLDDEVDSLRVVGMTMTASSEIGTIPGAASVGPTGQAGYSIPIEVPPGAGGLAPSLALQYGSGAGNGSFGLGWGVVGFSAIDRCAKTIADDGAFSPVEFDGDDALCLDGKRLVLYAGTHLEAGAEYRTKRDPFERIRILNYVNQPYFEVESRDGRISVYGRTAKHSQDKNGVKYIWLLESVRDRSGNQIDYGYVSDGASGTLRPKVVSWEGGRVDLVADPAGREDERRGFHFGEPWAQLVRVERIMVKGLDGELLYTYELDYQSPGLSDPPEPWQSATRSLLTSIEKCDAAGACLPATEFYYSASGTDIIVAAEELPGMPEGIEYLTQEEHESLEWNRKSIVGDFNGDREYEAIIWNPELHGFDLFEAGSVSSGEGVFGLYWPSDLPLSWEDVAHQLDAAARAGADADDEAPYEYVHGFGQPLWRVRPSMGYVVVNYDNDTRDDILYPVGNDLDAWGIGYADAIWIATQGSDFTDPGVSGLHFAEVVIDDLSSDPIYNVVPVDHDGNGLTDFWMCRGQGFKSSHWVLALNQGDTGSFTFSFHDSNVGCSIHDELNVIPLRGGADSLLVVPAYPWEPGELVYPEPGAPPQAYVDAIPPLDEATRTHYLELRFDPSSGQDGELVATDLPRDLFQRWRDRNCSNGNAVAQGGPPVFGAGLSLDRQVDLNGDGYLDIMRAELAVEPVGFPAGSADTHANIDAIQNNLGAGWGIGGTCQSYNPAIDHEPVALRGWINTGDGFERGDVLYHFSGNPHANLWANIVGGQLTDRDRDGFADLLVPSTGVGSDWTILKGSGDVFDCAWGECFEAEPITLPAGWPGYRSDATWKGDVHRGSVVQLRSVGGIAFEGADDYGSGPVRSVDYLAYGVYQGVGMRLVRAVDGLGGMHEFFYDCAHEDSVPPALVTAARPKSVPRTCLPVVKSHTTPGGQTIRYDYGDAVVDQHGRGFLGFDSVRTRTTSDLYDEIEVLTEFDFTYDPTLRDYPRAGLPSRTRTSRALGNPQPLSGSRVDVECTDITEWQVTPQTVSGGTTWFSYAAQTHTYASEVLGSVHGNDLPSCDDLGPFDRESFTECSGSVET